MNYKKLVLLIMPFLLISIVSALDLSDYPNMFKKDGEFQGYIIVGMDYDYIRDIYNKIAVQLNTNRIEYTNKRSDITTNPTNYNLISIGGSCPNSVTSRIKGNPSPCNQGLEENTGYIHLYENNRKIQLVVEGYNDKALENAVDVLTNSDNYNIKGTSCTITNDLDVECNNNELTLPEWKCTDTDAEVDYYQNAYKIPKDDFYEKGVTTGYYQSNPNFWYEEEFTNLTGEINSFTDSCVKREDGSVKLREFYCTVGDIVSFSHYDCPNGCKDGACVEDSDKTCKDSDGGIKEYEGGIATGVSYGSADSVPGESKDYCILSHGGGVEGKDGRVREKYCKNGLIYSIDIDCDYGCEYSSAYGSYCKREQPTTPTLPTPLQDFEQRFMLLNQRDKDAIEDFKNTINLNEWHVLINHGRFRPYYALRDWLGDFEFEEKYSDKTIDFKNFPYIFNYGGTFNGIVVIGSSATAKEREAAIYIHNSLKNFFSPATNWPMDPIVLDSDIEGDLVRNLITIGSPCNNAITAEVTHITSCDSNLKEGESALRLWDNDDFAQLAIAANSDEDLMVAAEYFVEHLNNMNPAYRDETFRDREIILGTCDGCFSRPDCIPFFEKVDGKYCDSDKKLKTQKQVGDSCQKGYECINNICKNDVCKPYCQGCYDINDNCVPIGTRSEDEYCDVSQEMLSQKQGDISCNNNHECKSNVCINNKCISTSLIQKLIDWFKRLFAGE